MTPVDWFRAVIGADVLPPAPVPAAVKLGKASLTGAQVRALYDVAARLAKGSAGVRDTEVVADIVIDAALSALAPGVAPLAIPAAEALVNFMIEHPSAHPIQEAQTNEGRGGRRP